MVNKHGVLLAMVALLNCIWEDFLCTRCAANKLMPPMLVVAPMGPIPVIVMSVFVLSVPLVTHAMPVLSILAPVTSHSLRLSGRFVISAVPCISMLPVLLVTLSTPAMSSVICAVPSPVFRPPIITSMHISLMPVPVMTLCAAPVSMPAAWSRSGRQVILHDQAAVAAAGCAIAARPRLELQLRTAIAASCRFIIAFGHFSAGLVASAAKAPELLP